MGWPFFRFSTSGFRQPSPLKQALHTVEIKQRLPDRMVETIDGPNTKKHDRPAQQ